jgi:hypothetical protein
MKKLFSILVLCLLAFIAPAQIYHVQTFDIGTNVIGSNANLALPLNLGQQIITNALQASVTNTIIVTNQSIVWSQGAASYTTNIYTNGIIVYTNTLTSYTNQGWTTNIVKTTNTVVAPSIIDNPNIANTYTTNSVTVTNQVSTFVVTNSSGAGYTTNIPLVSTNITLTLNSAYSTNQLYGASLFDVKRATTAAIQLQFQLTGTGTGNVTLNLAKSLAATIADTIGTTNIAVAANGTNLVQYTAELNAGNAGWFIASGITNANASAVTNLLIRYAQKTFVQ